MSLRANGGCTPSATLRRASGLSLVNPWLHTGMPRMTRSCCEIRSATCRRGGSAMTRRSWNLQIRLTSSSVARRVTAIPSERERWCCVCSRRSRDVHRFGRTRPRRCTLAAWPRRRSYRPGAAVTYLLDPESGRKWRGSPCFPSLILKMKSRAIKSHCVFL